MKVGIFSKKYYYISSKQDNFYLLPKEKVKDEKLFLENKNKTINFVESSQKKEVNKLKFMVTIFKLILYSIICLFISYLIRDKYMWIIVLWSINFHEFSHITVAKIIKSDRIWMGFKLKYRIIPIMYISNQDIYYNKKYERMLYYFAGILFNFSIGIIVLLFTKLVDINNAEVYAVLQATYYINLSIALINIIPFMFTDGYNLLREFIEIYDLRVIITKNFFHPIKLYKKGWIIFTYYIFVIIGIAFISCTVLMMIMKIL